MNQETPGTIVDLLFADHQSLALHLLGAGEVSLLNNVDGNFRKTLLRSAASYFEHALTESLTSIFSEKTNRAKPIVEFVRNKAIARQYHTYFKWSGHNANQFFGLFGSTFRSFMSELVDADSGLDDSIKAFLELGRLRNELVHQNFANFHLEKTAQEIYELYGKAHGFIEGFPVYLTRFLENHLQSV